MEHLHGLVLARQPVGDLPRTVGRAVVHHEHRVIGRNRRELRQHRVDDRLEVRGLVVGREHKPGGRHGPRTLDREMKIA